MAIINISEQDAGQRYLEFFPKITHTHTHRYVISKHPSPVIDELFSYLLFVDPNMKYPLP